jgi:hypothetical protein
MIGRAVVLASLLSACVAPATTPPSSVPIETPTVAVQTGAASASPTASPPTTTPAYQNAAEGYRLELPRPWRRSCNSTESQLSPANTIVSQQIFVAVSERDERWGSGYPFDGVIVLVVPNPDRLPVEQWAAQGGLGFAQTPGAPVTRATVDGRAALASVYEGVWGEQRNEIALASGDRVYVVTYYLTSSDRTNVPAMTAIVRSFHVLTASERASTPTAVPVTPRSAESVADALAVGFAKKDVTALAEQLGSCVIQGSYGSDASLAPAVAYAGELRRDLAAGLAVSVSPRPLLEYGGDSRYVRSTWTRPGKTAEEVDLLLRANGDRWYWAGAVIR